MTPLWFSQIGKLMATRQFYLRIERAKKMKDHIKDILIKPTAKSSPYHLHSYAGIQYKRSTKNKKHS